MDMTEAKLLPNPSFQSDRLRRRLNSNYKGFPLCQANEIHRAAQRSHSLVLYLLLHRALAHCVESSLDAMNFRYLLLALRCSPGLLAARRR